MFFTFYLSVYFIKQINFVQSINSYYVCSIDKSQLRKHEKDDTTEIQNIKKTKKDTLKTKQ